MPWPVYDRERDGPRVFDWILAAAAAERARRQAVCSSFAERQSARYRADLDLLRRVEEREAGVAS